MRHLPAIATSTRLFAMATILVTREPKRTAAQFAREWLEGQVTIDQEKRRPNRNMDQQ